MSKSLADKFKEAGLDAARGGGYNLLDPNDIQVILDKSHFLYDPRAEEALDESFIVELAEIGVHTPIHVWSNGSKDDGTPNVIVIAGRRRTLHLREANRRRAANGLTPFRIPTLTANGDDKKFILLALSENAHRKDESVESRAVKVDQARLLGCTEAEIARACGMSFSTVKQLTQFTALSSEVKDAIKSKELPLGAIGPFSDVPRELQPQVLEAVKKSGIRKSHEVGPAIKAVRQGKDVEVPDRKKMMSRKEIQAILDDLDDDDGDIRTPVIRATLCAVIGDFSPMKRHAKKYLKLFDVPKEVDNEHES